jgi:hypothetical protein
MSERAPYSRVYWAIIDDPKFKSIYDDNHHLASWMRLLLIETCRSGVAGVGRPHAGQRATRLRRRALVKAELIDLLDGGTTASAASTRGERPPLRRWRLAGSSSGGAHGIVPGSEPAPRDPQAGPSIRARPRPGPKPAKSGR